MTRCSTACAKTSVSCSTGTRGATRWEVLTCYPGLHALAWHRAGRTGCGARVPLARAVPRASGRGLHRHRDPPGRDDRAARVHRPRDGDRDRRDRRDRRRRRSTTASRSAGPRGTRASAIRRSAAMSWSAPGAKILGPITIGDGQGRFQRGRGPRHSGGRDRGRHPGAHLHAGDAERQQKQAAKIGFSAYAIGGDLDDPLVQAIHQLLDHTANDRRPDRPAGRSLEGGRCECGTTGRSPTASIPNQRIDRTPRRSGTFPVIVDQIIRE